MVLLVPCGDFDTACRINDEVTPLRETAPIQERVGAMDERKSGHANPVPHLRGFVAKSRRFDGNPLEGVFDVRYSRTF